MATDTRPLHERAKDAAEHFETATRADSDETYVRVKESAPEWLRELIYAAHGDGDFLPDDYRYAWTQDALEALAESDAESAFELASIEQAGDEFADDIDVYTGERFAWLSSNLNRASYCDDARDEGLVEPETDIIDRIGAGQMMERREVWGLIIRWLQDHES